MKKADNYKNKHDKDNWSIFCHFWILLIQELNKTQNNGCLSQIIENVSVIKTSFYDSYIQKILSCVEVKIEKSHWLTDFIWILIYSALDLPVPIIYSHLELYAPIINIDLEFPALLIYVCTLQCRVCCPLLIFFN